MQKAGSGCTLINCGRSSSLPDNNKSFRQTRKRSLSGFRGLFCLLHRKSHNTPAFNKITHGGFCCFTGVPAAFLTVGSGQTEREPAFLNIKLHVVRFLVCVGLLADRRITAAICKQTLFQGGVVGADMDKRVFFVKPKKYRWSFPAW